MHISYRMKAEVMFRSSCCSSCLQGASFSLLMFVLIKRIDLAEQELLWPVICVDFAYPFLQRQLQQ